MTHASEASRRLPVRRLAVASLERLEEIELAPGVVAALILPYSLSLGDLENSRKHLKAFAARLPYDSLLCILTGPKDAAELWLQLENVLTFQLWVAVKLGAVIKRPGLLHQKHGALLILSKYTSPLRHAKTRIAYSFCPACDRTTKDYGGKKHNYHEYGTLMSDVWRDIEWDAHKEPNSVIGRLRDVFGTDEYSEVLVVDASEMRATRLPKSDTAPPALLPAPPHLKSRLIDGDCLQELWRLPDESVDLCFADPPYNLDKDYSVWDDDCELRDYFSWCDRWLLELARVLRPGCTCAVLNIPLFAIRHFKLLKKLLEFQNWIVWDALSLPVRMIMPAHYPIVCFTKGPPRALPAYSPLTILERPEKAWVLTVPESFCGRADCVRRRKAEGVGEGEMIGDLWWDIHRLKHNSRRVDHPCQLPPALMKRLIATFTHKGEMVLDPFNGAGTTTLCAAQLGRRYIGIELSGQYHELARRRHDELTRGLDPFRKVDRIPTAKNSKVRRLPRAKYEVPKKRLQLEVKAIAVSLGRLPTRDDVAKMSRYPIRFFDEYFINWGEVCAAARTTGMTEKKAARKPTLPLASSD